MDSVTARPLVSLEKKGEIGTITLNNPPRNELSTPVLMQFREKLLEAQSDDEIKVVVIKSALINFFSAGASVLEIYQMIATHDRYQATELLDKAHMIVNFVANLGKPTVAFIRGYCLGGGNELALACTWRIASKDASLGQPEINLGIIPGMGGTQRLPRLVSLKKAMLMMLSGSPVPAKEAKEIGLIDDLVGKPEEWLEKGLWKNPRPDHDKNSELNFSALENDEQYLRALRRQMEKFPRACSSLITAVSAGIQRDLSSALELEKDLFSVLVMHEEAKTGVEAFLKLGKEPPKSSPVPGSEKNPDRSEELKMLKETVHDFCEKWIRPNVNKMESERRIMPEIIKEMAKLGFYGVPFDEKYGGSGLGLRGFAVMMREVSKYHGSTAVMMGAHTSLGLKPIALYGTEKQKMDWLTRSIRGEIIGAYATTEPNVGSDVASISTFAQKVDGGWKLDGAKQFISNGAIADFIIVLAQTAKYEDETDERRKKTMIVLIVPTSSVGFKITKPTETKMGLHASCTSAFSLDNVFIPDENLIGEVGQGFKIVMNVFNQSRITLGAGCVGALERAQEIMLDFIRSRKISGQMLYEYQATHLAVGKIEITRIMMEALVNQALDAYEKDPTSIREIAAAVKYICAEDGFWAIDRAMQTMGGAGYITDYGMELIYRDFRVNRIFEGTSEVQTMLVAKEWLKRKFTT